MKKFGLLIAIFILFSQLAAGQTTINFDTASNWIQDGTTALTSYANHAYAESGVTIQGTSVLRNTTTIQDGYPGALGTYSMRINTTTSAKATITVSSGGISTFSIKVRRWDASPMPNYTVKYSLDGGTNWTNLTNIDGDLLTSSDWFTYSGTINDASSNIMIEIANNTITATERIMIDDFTWTGYGSSSSPILIATPNNLSGFTYIASLGPSSSQSYSLSGIDLDGSDVTINAPTNFEVSLDNTTWFDSRTLTAFDGTATTIYIRLQSGLSVGTYSGNVTNAGGGATTQNVAVSGNVTAPISTLPFEENFDYEVGSLTSNGGSNVSGGNWVNFSGSDNYLQVTSGNLFYTNYESSGIGAKVDMINTSSSAEDARRPFTEITTGSIYASLLLNVTNDIGLNTTGDYLFSMRNETGTNTGYKGLLFIKSEGSGFVLGVRPATAGTAASFYSSVLSFGTTYLVVIKYSIVAGSANDIVSLWVNPNLSSSEPSADINVTADGSTTEPDGIDGIALRQGTNTPNCSIDGIRVATTWSDAPLPVELSSFSASVIGNGVKLNWRTETETNNYGFEIQRLQDYTITKLQDWKTIGFVEGYGNSNSPKDYTYTDASVTSGTYGYRLKQIDNDGTFSYSKIIEVDLGAPTKYELAQNFPNPFNPTTAISFTLPETGNVRLTVFNLLGQEVATLVNEVKEAGMHIINFNAEGLNSGVYIYRIESGSFNEVRKMTLIK